MQELTNGPKVDQHTSGADELRRQSPPEGISAQKDASCHIPPVQLQQQASVGPLPVVVAIPVEVNTPVVPVVWSNTGQTPSVIHGVATPRTQVMVLLPHQSMSSADGQFSKDRRSVQRTIFSGSGYPGISTAHVQQHESFVTAPVVPDVPVVARTPVVPVEETSVQSLGPAQMPPGRC